MKLAKSLITASALGLVMLGNAGAADAPRNLQPLFGEFIAANAGLEVAIPLFNFVDDFEPFGYPEKVVVSYRVYAIGSTTPLLTTPGRTILTPAIPTGCTDPNLAEFDWNILFARRGAQLDSSGTPVSGSTRIHLGINMELDCYDGVAQNWVWSDGSGVYSADLSGVGTSWVKNFAGKHLLGLNGIDTNGDLVNDQVTITTISGPEGTQNATVIVVNGGTGVANSSNTYAVIR